MEKEKVSQMFVTLVYSLQMQAMMSLGKLKNPMTDKTERDLEAAQVSIDMIEMIKEKTTNNLTHDENRAISSILADLKLNYVEESGKPAVTESNKSSAATEDSEKGGSDSKPAEK